MKVLILGKNGMLGSDLVKVFKNCIAFGKDDLDITDREKVLKLINQEKPDVVINSVGFTKVDEAEIKREEAYKLNFEGAKNVADACKNIRATMVYISTDYVFDGKKKNYKENERKNPINFYGKTKAEAEDYIINSYDKYYIIRTAWLFGKKGSNFINFVLEQKDKKEISIADDQFGSPTYTLDLAKKIKEIVEKQKYGIYHITNKGYCSWKQFAEEIVRIKKIDLIINGINSEKLGRIALRPKEVMLVNTKTDELRQWQEALREYLGK